MSAILNAFTVDVEDYYQVSAFAASVDKNEWSAFESRVEKNTDRLLAMLDERSIQGTFFVLGWVAERHPELVRRIRACGHELACHGFSHDLVYQQSPETFRQETIRSKHCLEDIVGEPVLGYRAASYSITRKSLWALDILAEVGFVYDSSIFPINHDRYGIATAPRFPFRLELESGASIVEFPLTTWRFLGLQLPVAGGGYFRLLPYAYTRKGLSDVNRDDKAPVVFYLHPWELDPGQPRIPGASLLSRFRHYSNLDKVEERLHELLELFEFGTMRDALDTLTNFPRHNYENSNDIS